MLIHEGFQQQPYTLAPFYDSDTALRGILERTLPPAIWQQIDAELRTFQDRLAGRTLVYLASREAAFYNESVQLSTRPHCWQMVPIWSQY
jgi:hypothetical protein